MQDPQKSPINIRPSELSRTRLLLQLLLMGKNVFLHFRPALTREIIVFSTLSPVYNTDSISPQ